MTDETTEPTPAEADAAEAGSVMTEPAPEPTPEVAEVAPAEKVSFWHRPNVERYLLPLVTPILVVVGIVVVVLNISRIFLSAHGHIPVVIGSIILVAILLGATLFSNSSQLRSQSIALMTAGFVFVVLCGGWLVLGHSQVKSTGGTALPASGPINGKIDIVAAPTGGLSFAPASLTVPTGVYLVTLKDGAAAQHTLDFDSSEVQFAGLVVNNQGETKSTRIFFGTAQDYTFFCAIPGHRAAGMAGVVHVTGPTVTLADAEAKGKPSGDAAASG
jgi:plastocyanin